MAKDRRPPLLEALSSGKLTVGTKRLVLSARKTLTSVGLLSSSFLLGLDVRGRKVEIGRYSEYGGTHQSNKVAQKAEAKHIVDDRIFCLMGWNRMK